jgi:drug/metabolite transporter (DMT)-like permease
LLGASASWALGTLVTERHDDAFPPLAFAALELLAGGVILLPISVASGELPRIDLANLSAASLLGWSYLTLLGTVVAFAAYTWLLKQVSPTSVATYTFVNPIIAVLVGWAFLGEKPTARMVAGGALVVASVAGLLLVRSRLTSAEADRFSSVTSASRPAD